jgi:hypothetical protein
MKSRNWPSCWPPVRFWVVEEEEEEERRKSILTTLDLVRDTHIRLVGRDIQPIRSSAELIMFLRSMRTDCSSTGSFHSFSDAVLDRSF